MSCSSYICFLQVWFSLLECFLWFPGMLPWAGMKWDHLVVVIWYRVDTAAVCFHWSRPHHRHQNFLPLVRQLYQQKLHATVRLKLTFLLQIQWTPTLRRAIVMKQRPGNHLWPFFIGTVDGRSLISAQPTWGSYLMRMSYSMEWGMLSTVNSRKAPSGTLTSPTPVQVGLRSSGCGLGTTVTPWRDKINNLPPVIWLPKEDLDSQEEFIQSFLGLFQSLKSQTGSPSVTVLDCVLPVRTWHPQLRMYSDPGRWSKTLISPDHNVGRTCALCKCTGPSPGHTWEDGKKHHAEHKWQFIYWENDV